MQQQIQYCTTPDGVRLAYSQIGKGTPLVRLPHWVAHLEYDLKSPLTQHMTLGLSHRHRLLRYDARGIGMSQREVAEISFDRWVDDLETVVDRVGLERFALVGLSQGVAIAIAYAVRHPERVSHLILYGGYARGHLHRGDVEKQKQSLELLCSFIREGWGGDQDAYRQFFTTQFMPGGTTEQHRWLNELERIAAAPEMAERFMRTAASVNVFDLLPLVKTPTLVLHCRDDLRAPFELGQEIAAGIPGAKFVPLDGRNHTLLPNAPETRKFFEATADFLGDRPFKGALPGSTKLKDRLDNALRSAEQNWFTKLVIILAAGTGIIIFGFELWRIFRPH
jgi:pimeloyl-ACP methyl ester carboxylesterase